VETVTLRVDGMTCQGCVLSVTRVLLGVPGVRHAEVSLERAQATVEFDPGQVSTAALKQAIAAAGYEAG